RMNLTAVKDADKVMERYVEDSLVLVQSCFCHSLSRLHLWIIGVCQPVPCPMAPSSLSFSLASSLLHVFCAFLLPLNTVSI
ncbi:hypothetical protein S245_051411, partial [Arachis hypogaea]